MDVKSECGFQSTLSVRRATEALAIMGKDYPFQSTLSVRRATLTKTEVQRIRRISIHALREESDCSRMTLCSKHGYFNPRSP